MQEIHINSNEAGQRFDKYLLKYFKEAGSSFIYKMLRKKNIELNGNKASGSEKIKEGDVIKIFMSDETIQKFRGIALDSVSVNKKNAIFIKNNLLYEDKHVLFVNKPVGILSQKASATDISVNEMIIDYLLYTRKLTQDELKTFKPSVCNRLDRNTTGIITFGKTLTGVQELSKGFKERSFDKYYLAAVWGKVFDSSVIDGYLIKNEKTNKVEICKNPKEGASHIVTEYKPLATGNVKCDTGFYDITLLKIKLITGKTHQIRAHLGSIGHGILGDDKYGIMSRNAALKKNLGIKYQMLHAYEMVFSGELQAEALKELKGKNIVCHPDKNYKKIFGVEL